MTTATQPLAGEVVVVTGVVQGLKRWEADAAIVEAGGIAADSVTQATTLLVIGDKPGATKLSKAASLDVPTISEAEFRQRLGLA